MYTAINRRRNREPNFTTIEEDIFLDLVKQFAPILENRKSIASIWEEKKKAWNTITEQFNIKTDMHRTKRNLRFKYENLKQKAKKELLDSLSGKGKISRVSEVMLTFMRTPNVTESVVNYTENGFSNAEVPVNEIKTEKPDYCSDSREAELTTESDIALESNLENDRINIETDESSTERICSDVNPEPMLSWNENLANDAIHHLNNKKTRRRRIRLSEILARRRIELFNAKITYFLSEEKRAMERHSWEKEKLNREKEIQYIKLQSMKIDFELKKKQLLDEATNHF